MNINMCGLHGSETEVKGRTDNNIIIIACVHDFVPYNYRPDKLTSMYDTDDDGVLKNEVHLKLIHHLISLHVKQGLVIHACSKNNFGAQMV